MMNRRVEKIPAELYDDEAVRFIADRYHAAPREIVRCFFMQDGIMADSEEEPVTFRLEDNEMEILRGLTGSFRS